MPDWHSGQADSSGDCGRLRSTVHGHGGQHWSGAACPFPPCLARCRQLHGQERSLRHTAHEHDQGPPHSPRPLPGDVHKMVMLLHAVAIMCVGKAAGAASSPVARRCLRSCLHAAGMHRLNAIRSPGLLAAVLQRPHHTVHESLYLPLVSLSHMVTLCTTNPIALTSRPPPPLHAAQPSQNPPPKKQLSTQFHHTPHIQEIHQLSARSSQQVLMPINPPHAEPPPPSGAPPPKLNGGCVVRSWMR